MFPIVRELEALLSKNSYIRSTLLSSIIEADIDGIKDITSYFHFLDACVCWVPVFKESKEFYSRLAQFYWFLGGPSGNILQKDPLFSQWLLKFLQRWGEFLETRSSVDSLYKLIEDPVFCMSDYECPRDNWKSFNHFMRRSIKPNKRSFACFSDDHVLSFPVDGIYRGCQDIKESSIIKMDNMVIYLDDILSNTAYKNHFIDGTLLRISMFTSDYQRYVMPSSGVVLDQQKIPTIVSFNVTKDKSGKLCIIGGDNCQFVQDRGIIIFKNGHMGLVAIVPIGLVQVASVIFNSDIGSSLKGGDDLGYFESGGSDLIMLCSNKKVRSFAVEGKHYKQGEKIAYFI